MTSPRSKPEVPDFAIGAVSILDLTGTLVRNRGREIEKFRQERIAAFAQQLDLLIAPEGVDVDELDDELRRLLESMNAPDVPSGFRGSSPVSDRIGPVRRIDGASWFRRAALGSRSLSLRRRLMLLLVLVLVTLVAVILFVSSAGGIR
jgi:hypothetical protein